MQLALLLAQSGVRFVIVGGTARLLRGSARRPTDLDIVIRRPDTGALRTDLPPFTTTRQQLRPDSASPQRLMTSWSTVDVFVEDELPAWHTVEIDGMKLRVADD